MHELARSSSYISARSGDIIVAILTQTYKGREPWGTDVGPVYVKKEERCHQMGRIDISAATVWSYFISDRRKETVKWGVGIIQRK